MTEENPNEPNALERHTRAIRTIEKRRTAAAGDSKALGEGAAALRRLRSEPSSTTLVALDELAAAARELDEQVEACSAAIASLRNEGP